VTRNCRHLTTLIAALVAAVSLFGQTTENKDSTLTAVQGESWIRHLHRAFNDGSMGRTWDLGPAAPLPGETTASWQLDLSPGYGAQSVTLHGSDLYRLNCRACHGQLGHGAPPEINSIIGPVQATSVAVTMDRMKKAGREMARSDAITMAKEAKVLLLERLHKGGQNMPPPHLTEAEIRSLVPYLEQLSDIPGAEKNQIAVNESSLRVGEHIVKSTCHICHSATGPNPTPDQILKGEIPPLTAVIKRVNLSEFVRKVTSGAPIVMGNPSAFYRGRMPVFSYLSQDEAAAAYLYLTRYPPQP